MTKQGLVIIFNKAATKEGVWWMNIAAPAARMGDVYYCVFIGNFTMHNVVKYRNKIDKIVVKAIPYSVTSMSKIFLRHTLIKKFFWHLSWLLYLYTFSPYGVYISQLIRYARASYSDFLKRHLHLRNRLLDQGYEKIRLIRLRHTLIKKFFWHLSWLLYLYTFSLCENASLIIVSAEREYISTRSWYRNINFSRDRIRRIFS
jgi:hypothetical protein